MDILDVVGDDGLEARRACARIMLNRSLNTDDWSALQVVAAAPSKLSSVPLTLIYLHAQTTATYEQQTSLWLETPLKDTS